MKYFMILFVILGLAGCSKHVFQHSRAVTYASTEKTDKLLNTTVVKTFRALDDIQSDPEHFGILTATIDSKTRNILSIQYYIEFTEYNGRWMDYAKAEDEDGNKLKVAKIDRKQRCHRFIKQVYSSCEFKEHVAISILSKQFLELKSDGFDIKLYGEREDKLLKVKGLQIKEFLMEVKKVRNAK